MLSIENNFNKPPLRLLQVQDKIELNIKKSILNLSVFKKYYSPTIQQDIQDTLKLDYHNKCAYCESKFDMLNITRYRPRNRYPWLALEWSNLLPTCQACNISKADKFPIENISASIPPIDLELWKANSEVLAKEGALLLHPAIDNASYNFKFDESGRLIPNKNNLRAITTIDVFNLNRADLVQKRRNLIFGLQRSLLSKQRAFDLLNAAFVSSEDESEIITFFDDFIDNLVRSARPDSEFSFLGYNLIKYFDDFFIKTLKLSEEYQYFINHVYKNYIKDSVNDSIFNRRAIEYGRNTIEHTDPVYLDYLQVQDFFCIKNIVLENLKTRKEIYILGENGDGKTLLLQSVVLGLKWAYIRTHSDKKDTGVIHDIIEKSSDISIVAKCTNKAIYSLDTDQYINNVFAYGVHRSKRNSLESIDKEGFISLFSDNVSLVEPIEWIKELDRRSNYKNTKNKTTSLVTAIKLFEDLLGKNIRIVINENTGDISFVERGTTVAFKELSEGYKSVMTWASDLLFRLMDNQPTVTKIRDYTGIVLVDEVDLHLHPRWSKSLARKLRRWFPKIQFIFSTHSPSMVMGASNDAVFYRIYKDGGISCISEPFYNEDMSTMMLNGLITSPLFGLDDARMSNLKKDEEPDQSENYLHREIYDIVQTQVDELKSEGKTYVDPETIKNLINNALSRLDTQD